MENETWTLSSLKAYVEAVMARTDVQIAALDRLTQSQRSDDLRALDNAVDAQAEALQIARQEMDSRLTRLNDLRENLADAQSQLMPRAEAKLLIDAIVARVEAIQKGVSDLSSVIASLRSGISGQNAGLEEAQDAATRTRTIILAALTIFVMVVGVVVTLLVSLR